MKTIASLKQRAIFDKWLKTAKELTKEGGSGIVKFVDTSTYTLQALGETEAGRMAAAYTKIARSAVIGQKLDPDSPEGQERMEKILLGTAISLWPLVSIIISRAEVLGLELPKRMMGHIFQTLAKRHTLG